MSKRDYIVSSAHLADPGSEDAEPALPQLQERSVLCVGGRPASIPVYRHLIERTGGRFLHHDGGDEENVNKLDATLAAAQPGNAETQMASASNTATVETSAQ